MFADNDVISSRQLFMQLTLGMLGVFLMVLPGFGEIIGVRGALYCVGGFLLTALYCFFLVRLAPALRHPEKTLGVWGARLMGLWFLLYFVATGAFLINIISDVAAQYLITGASPYWLHAVILLACAMASAAQAQRRGRMAEACFGVLVGILLVLLILCMARQNWTYLEQEFSGGDFRDSVLVSGGNTISNTSGAKGWDLSAAARGIYQYFAAFTGIGALPFLLNQVKDHRCRSMIRAAAILTAFLVLVLLLLQGSYGTAQVRVRSWPLITLISGIRIPGSFTARLDPLWIAIFLMLMLFSVGSTLFYCNFIAQKTNLPARWYWILLAVYVVSLVDFDGYNIKEMYAPLLLYVFAPSILLMNLGAGLWYHRRKKGKIIVTALVILVSLMLDGCRRVEPELRAYPLALGFDMAEGRYRTFYAMPDLGTYTGEGKAEKKESLLWCYQGSDYENIDALVDRTREQAVDLGHVQVILLGDGILEDTEAYDTTMEYLLQQPVLGSGAYVLRCPDMESVMQENGGMTDSLGEYLADLIRKKGGEEPAVLQNLYNAWYNGEAIPELTTVQVTGDGIEVRE